MSQCLWKDDESLSEHNGKITECHKIKHSGTRSARAARWAFIRLTEQICRRCTKIYTVDHHNIGLPLNTEHKDILGVLVVRLLGVFMFSIIKDTDIS